MSLQSCSRHAVLSMPSYAGPHLAFMLPSLFMTLIVGNSRRFPIS